MRGALDMNWKYKEPLKDKNVFKEIEDKYDIKIPDTLKRLVIDANGGTPEKYRVMVNNTESFCYCIVIQ